MRKTAKAVEPHQIITQDMEHVKKLWKHIHRKAVWKYNKFNGEDVAQEAVAIAIERGYFCREQMSEAARNLGVFRTAYTSKHTILLPPKSEKACKNKEIEIKDKGLDERLVSIIRDAVDPRVRAVIRDVLGGEDIVKSCEINGLSYRTFIKICRQATVQPNLFGEEAA